MWITALGLLLLNSGAASGLGIIALMVKMSLLREYSNHQMLRLMVLYGKE